MFGGGKVGQQAGLDEGTTCVDRISVVPMASMFRTSDVRETLPLMGGTVATAGGDADSVVLPERSTLGAVPRRIGARTVAAIAAVTAVAAVSLSGIAGSPHLVQSLGAGSVRPNGRGVDNLIDHRPGEDLWDMIDRGLTETKRSSGARRASKLGSSEDSRVDAGLTNQQETRFEQTQSDVVNLGSGKFNTAGTSPEFEEVTEDALARLPQAQRSEARAELRRASRESKHADSVAQRTAERKQQRSDAKQFERKRERYEKRVFAARENHRVDRSRMGQPATGNGDGVAGENMVTQTESTVEVVSTAADTAAAVEAAVEQTMESTHDIAHDAQILEYTPGPDSSYDTHDYDYGGDVESHEFAEGPSAPHHDPAQIAARREKRIRKRLQAEARAEEVRLQAQADEAENAVKHESVRLANEADYIEREIHETQTTREFRQEAAEEALAAALDVADEVAELHDTYNQPGNRTAVDMIDSEIASMPIDLKIMQREDDVVEDPKRLENELEALEDELRLLEAPGPESYDDELEYESLDFNVTNATISKIDEQYDSDDFVWDMPPNAEAMAAADAMAASAHANATAHQAHHESVRAAAVVRAEADARASGDENAVDDTTFSASQTESRTALRVSLRLEEQAAEAWAAALEAERLATDAAAQQELAVLQARLVVVEREEVQALSDEENERLRAERKQERVEERHAERAEEREAAAPGPAEMEEVSYEEVLYDDSSSMAPEPSPFDFLPLEPSHPLTPLALHPPAPSSPGHPPMPAHPSHPSHPQTPPPFTREEYDAAVAAQNAYAYDITTAADYENVVEDYAYEQREAELMVESLAKARAEAYDDDNDNDVHSEINFAATAKARVGKSKSSDFSETQQPRREIAANKQQLVRAKQRAKERKANRHLKEQRVAGAKSHKKTENSRRFDIDGWVLDDSSMAVSENVEVLDLAESNTQNSGETVARLAATREAEEVAELSLKQAYEPKTVKQSLEDILGAKLDLESEEATDVARPGTVYETAEPVGEHVGEHVGYTNDDVASVGYAAQFTRGEIDENGRPDVVAFHNSFGAIPGLLEHVRENHGLPARETGMARDIAPDTLQVLTYANSKYWPVVKVLLNSLEHNVPAVLSQLTIMLTDAKAHKECEYLSLKLGHSCFLDLDMRKVLGVYAEHEGSQVAGDLDSANSEIGKALRIAWCWRKVHAVYSLVSGGYPAVFFDASTVVLQDFRQSVAARLAHAEMVTLSDFGGAKEQQAINTGLLAAAPDTFPILSVTGSSGGLPNLRKRNSKQLFEEWMAFEPEASDTEQAYLTWDLAPKARERGDVIVALPHDKFPSYVTFEEQKHVALSGGNLGLDAGNEDVRGVTVHAAYCGSVAGKLAFLNRVELLGRGIDSPITVDELKGCDDYDKAKYRNCGHAPWDGDC